ncbi:hypothetical protein [Nonomuraea sp. SYSU D8015]|uniref:hypothetical protein n=1 Tax=Nonomuraea sp. SYSU D8015 TaxID=2593644 RepID=UPI001661178D|nr:hypothetical protein [Nonomuraea sp. SYSU D8015]
MEMIDFPYADPREGLTRRLSFGERDIAVIYVDLDVITVNWTTSLTVTGFVGTTDELVLAHEHDPVLLVMHDGSTLDEVTSGLIGAIEEDPAGFEARCSLLRFDLSPTRSIAWQDLPSEDLTIAGIGTTPSCVVSGGMADQIGWLLDATASSGVNRAATLDQVRSLARRFDGVDFTSGS